MAIVIEGPDGAGKSTLIKQLQDLYPQLQLRPRPVTSVDGPVTDLVQYVQSEAHVAQTRGEHFLYDRHPLISEPIYGKMTRGHTKIGFNLDDSSLNNERESFVHDNLVILCLPPTEAVVANVLNSSDIQMAGVMENITKIYEAYEKRSGLLSSMRSDSLIEYDYTTLLGFHEVLRAVNTYLGQDSLRHMMALQEYLQTYTYGNGEKPQYYSQEGKIEFIKTNHMALIDEMHEALAEVGWKPWASSRHINREAFKGEMVDVLHFFMNLLIVNGITPEELYLGYISKRGINVARQAEGYDGVSTKCKGCGRALDDKAVNCKIDGEWYYCERETGWSKV